MGTGVDVSSVDCEFGAVGPPERLFPRNKRERRVLETFFRQVGVSGAQPKRVSTSMVGADANCSLNLRSGCPHRPRWRWGQCGALLTLRSIGGCSVLGLTSFLVSKTSRHPACIEDWCSTRRPPRVVLVYIRG